MMRQLVNMLQLLFAPNAFVAKATDLAIAQEFLRNHQLKAKYPDERLPEEERKNFETTMRQRTAAVRLAFANGIGTTLAAILVGIGVGLLLQRAIGGPSKLGVYALQGGGAAIILGATLAEVGRKIQSYSGRTLPEEVNGFMFRAFYVLGTFLFVVSVSWDAT